MIRIDAVRERIADQVPALAGKLEAAGKFADLIERNQVPQMTPAGFVLLGGLKGGPAEMSAGAFIQNFTEGTIVVICDRYAGDALGARSTDLITPIVRDVINAVCGWGPDDAPGVFTLDAAELVGVKGGILIFEIVFRINDQLRIIS